MSTVFNFTFVPWFRSVAPYIHKFRHQTFVIGLPDKLTTDLLVRTAHLNFNRLRRDLLAVGITQQTIEQNSFTGTVEITWTKDKKLQRLPDWSGNRKLS